MAVARNTSDDSDEYTSDSDESEFDLDAFNDEENLFGADFKLRGGHGRMGLLFSGATLTLEAALVIILSVFYLVSERFGVMFALIGPVLLSTALQMIGSYLRGVEVVPLILYPGQVHYFLHALGGIEVGQQTLRFTGVRNTMVLCQSGPMMAILAALLLDADNEKPGGGEVRFMRELGEAAIYCAWLLASVNTCGMIIADRKPKKTRVSRTVPIDTFKASMRERFTVMMYTVSELMVSALTMALIAHLYGAAVLFQLLFVMYIALVFGWRWWARKMKDRKTMFVFACLVSVPNLFGVFFTAGDAEASFIYSFVKPLAETDKEFIRMGVWRPDFLALHCQRMVGVLATIIIGLTGTFTATFSPHPDNPDVNGSGKGNRDLFVKLIVAFLVIQNCTIGIHYLLQRLNVLAWGRFASSRTRHRQRMAERKKAHKKRFGERLGYSSSDSDDTPADKARRARRRARERRKAFEAKPEWYKKTYRRLQLAWKITKMVVTCCRCQFLKWCKEQRRLRKLDAEERERERQAELEEHAKWLAFEEDEDDFYAKRKPVGSARLSAMRDRRAARRKGKGKGKGKAAWPAVGDSKENPEGALATAPSSGGLVRAVYQGRRRKRRRKGGSPGEEGGGDVETGGTDGEPAKAESAADGRAVPSDAQEAETGDQVEDGDGPGKMGACVRSMRLFCTCRRGSGRKTAPAGSSYAADKEGTGGDLEAGTGGSDAKADGAPSSDKARQDDGAGAASSPRAGQEDGPGRRRCCGCCRRSRGSGGDGDGKSSTPKSESKNKAAADKKKTKNKNKKKSSKKLVVPAEDAGTQGESTVASPTGSRESKRPSSKSKRKLSKEGGDAKEASAA